MIPISKYELEMFRKLIDYAIWAEDNSLPCSISIETLQDLKERL